MKITALQKHIRQQIRVLVSDAQLAEHLGRRSDAELTAFVPRELEAIIAGAYRVLYKALKARSFIPLQEGIPAFAQTVKYNIYDRFGIAALIASYADDLPRADIVKDEVRSPIRAFGDSYGYNVEELMASEAGQLPLEPEKANAARMAYEEKLDRVAANGDSANGLVGLLNIPNALSFTFAADGTGSSKVWTTKTTDQVLRDMNAFYQFMRDQTGDVHSMRRIILPIAQDNYINTTPRSSNSDKTIKQFFLEAHPDVEVVSWYKLKGAGAAATDRMVGYIPDSQFISLVENMPFTQFPPQARNLELVVPCMGKSGGVVCKYPLTVQYGDGF